jgi:hypothetical protein
MNSATQQKQEDSQTSWSIYRFTELSVRGYIQCYCYGNLSALIKSGMPPQEEIYAAWQDVEERWAEAMGDAEYVMYLRLFKEIAHLSTDYKLIGHAIELLYIKYHAGIAAELNKLLRTNFDFSADNRIELLKRCTNRSKSIKINLDLKMMQYEETQKRMNATGEKPGEEYFLNILISLSDHAGYALQDSVSCYEFCDRFKRLMKFINKQKK